MPMEQPLPEGNSPIHQVERTKRRPRKAPAAPVAPALDTAAAPAAVDAPVAQAPAADTGDVARDQALIFTPAIISTGKIVQPERTVSANGCPVSLKDFGQGRYLVNGIFTDFTLPAQKALMPKIKAMSRGTKKNSLTAKEIISAMKAGTIDAGYYSIYMTVDGAGGITVDLIKKIFALPPDGAAAPAPTESARPTRREKVDFSAGEKLLAAPVSPVATVADVTPEKPADYSPSELKKVSDRVGYAPEGIGPKWASLPILIPDFHSMPEPIAIGRDAIATPNLTNEQRVTAREFGDGALNSFCKALTGSGDLQSSTEKVIAAAQSTSLFINPGALTKAMLDLSSAVRYEGKPGQEAESISLRNERVAEAVTAANRQLSTAGLYVAVAAPLNGPARAEAYVLRGKRSVQVLGGKEFYDLKQLTGPLGWYGFYVTKLDVQLDIRAKSLEFGRKLSEYLASEMKTGELVSRPNGLANTVQSAWGIETLVRRLYGHRIPTGEEFGRMWADALVLHGAFDSFFRKNGGSDKAIRMTNETTARGIAEQASFLYSIAQMDPRFVHIAVCVIADRCFRLETASAASIGGRRMFDNFQTESGIQLLDSAGKLRMEGLRDLIALDADRIQQMAAESLVREVIRVYLPGTY